MNRAFKLFALASLMATAALILGGWPATAQPADSPTGDASAQLVPEIPEDDEPRPEEIPDPEDPPRPDDGPGEIKDNDPCPTHGPCGDKPDEERDPGDDDDDDSDDDIRKPTRIDAGAGASDDDLELAWVLTGGALITASGAAMVARRRTLTEA
jgi:hypothetical protein